MLVKMVMNTFIYLCVTRFITMPFQNVELDVHCLYLDICIIRLRTTTRNVHDKRESNRMLHEYIHITLLVRKLFRRVMHRN